MRIRMRRRMASAGRQILHIILSAQWTERYRGRQWSGEAEGRGLRKEAERDSWREGGRAKNHVKLAPSMRPSRRPEPTEGNARFEIPKLY
uniref:Uncharacterized protein n=1 Tax=Vespula pensylvanica TaxID=30213 RepID=A0A834JPW2_VESPE|nr:hypothetical protein H0235_017333 [Vespula pensylvanica]